MFRKTDKLFVLLTLFVVFFNPVYAIDEASDKKVLYLSDCIDYGIKNSPIIKKAKLNIKIADKNVSIAKSSYSPTLGAGIAYWQGVNSNKDFDDGYTKRFAPTIAVFLNQLIYDFGKTSANIDMQKFYKIVSKLEYIDSICSIVNDIKLKYFEVLEAKAAIEIEENNLNISREILDVTEKLYKEGKKKEIDYINAQLYLSSAKMNLTDVRNKYNQAKADLANAMYFFNEPDFEIKSIDTFDYYDAYFSPEFIETPKGKWHEIKNRERQKGLIGEVQNLPFSLEYAQTYTFENSPEIKSLYATLEAMKKASLVTKRQYLPSLTGKVGYEHDSKYVQNIDHTYRNDQFNVAVNLNSTINPLGYKSQLDKADYQIQLAENDIELFKQNIFFDIKKKYMDVETAQLQIRNAIDKVHKAKSNIEASKRSYVNGDIGYLELQSARQNYNAAKLSYINELKNYNVALANLEKLTHIHSEKYHEDVEKE